MPACDIVVPVSTRITTARPWNIRGNKSASIIPKAELKIAGSLGLSLSPSVCRLSLPFRLFSLFVSHLCLLFVARTTRNWDSKGNTWEKKRRETLTQFLKQNTTQSNKDAATASHMQIPFWLSNFSYIKIGAIFALSFFDKSKTRNNDSRKYHPH